MAKLHDLGVAEAAKAIRTGEIKAEALADALLARAAAHKSLNAFIALEPDKVRAAAREADRKRASGASIGPLHGVPLALKDNLDTIDYPTTGGTPGLAGNRPKRNAVIVQALLDAGAIALGKCNLHELAYGITIHPPLVDIAWLLRLARRAEHPARGLDDFVTAPEPLCAAENIAGVVLAGSRDRVEQRFRLGRFVDHRGAGFADKRLGSAERVIGAQTGVVVIGVEACIHARFVVGGANQAGKRRAGLRL